MQSELILLILSGAAAFAAVFAVPSEADSAVWLGFSPARLGLGVLVLLAVIGLSILYIREKRSAVLTKALNGLLKTDASVRNFFALLLLILFGFLWLFWFSWLFVPHNLRPVILWGAVGALGGLILFSIRYKSIIFSKETPAHFRLLPRLSDLTAPQKKTLLILLVLSMIYLILLYPSEISGTENEHAWLVYGGDEYVIYPILQAVLTPGKDFSGTLYHHYIYEDYHYGYPFYAWSALLTAPLRLFLGPDYLDRIEWTIPVLRYGVSVLPLLFGCLILVFLFTRFQNPLLSSAVYIFLITAPGSLQNNQGFWHPDGLNFLFICAALYFLQRDRFRYGRNFFAAAFCVGLSAATRLYGFFFFLAVGVYLVMGVLQRDLAVRSAFRRGLLFILLMFGTILWADPFIFRSDARAKMVAILTEKTGEMSSGYGADFDDPRNDYRPGWDAWYPAFEDHYAKMFCFFFLLGSLAIGCFCRSGYRLTCQVTLCWWVVIAVYLIFFVAVKSTQYVLPMMLPLMANIFTLPQVLPKYKKPAWAVSAGIFLAQLVFNLIRIAPRFL